MNVVEKEPMWRPSDEFNPRDFVFVSALGFVPAPDYQTPVFSAADVQESKDFAKVQP
jgi:hypothetical protein